MDDESLGLAEEVGESEPTQFLGEGALDPVLERLQQLPLHLQPVPSVLSVLHSYLIIAAKQSQPFNGE